MTRLRRRSRSPLAVLSVAVAATLGAPSSQAQAPSPPSGAIWVRVLGPDSLPLPDAEVVLPMMGLALKVPEGGALLLTGVPAGVHMLQARRIGLAPAWRTLRVEQDTTIVQLALGLTGEALDTIMVYGTPPHFEARLNEFEHRRRTNGFGRYLTRGDIEEWRPADVATLLRRVNGINVSVGRGGTKVTSRRALTTSACNGMLIFLDGVQVAGQRASDATRLPTSSLEGKGAGGNRPAPPQPGGETNPNPPAGGGSGSGGSGTGGTGTGGTGTGTPRTRGSNGRAAAALGGGNREPDWASVASSSASFSAPAVDVNSLPLRLIAGVEVYPSGAGVPAPYNGYRGAAECGVMLIWTGGL